MAPRDDTRFRRLFHILQRSYDMLLHDVALMNLHVVFAVDRRAQGAPRRNPSGDYDVGFLQTVPNMKILCPASRCSKVPARRAVVDGPVAVRYPKSAEGRHKDASAQDAARLPGAAEGADHARHLRRQCEHSRRRRYSSGAGIMEIIKLNTSARFRYRHRVP